MSEQSQASKQTSSGPDRRLAAVLVPWFLAGVLALAAAQATRLYLAARAEAISERREANLADLELRSTRNQLEAERILSRREIDDLSKALKQAAPPKP